MKRLLCLLLTLLMLFGMTSCAGKKENDPLKTILSGMTLRDKAAQMMIASFRVWQELPPEGEEPPEEKPPKVNITVLNDEIRNILSRNHFGGILLYGQNFVDAEQTLRLISDYQTTNQTGGGLPAEDAVWSVNLPAGLLACFGQLCAEGVSPVELPALDDRYMPTGKTES